jgi:hypothetical protein
VPRTATARATKRFFIGKNEVSLALFIYRVRNAPNRIIIES